MEIVKHEFHKLHLAMEVSLVLDTRGAHISIVTLPGTDHQLN